jgi:hypothetical protein
MRALIRVYDDGVREVYPEPEWTTWTKNNLDREIAINGWTLIENYEPPEVEVNDI